MSSAERGSHSSGHQAARLEPPSGGLAAGQPEASGESTSEGKRRPFGLAISLHGRDHQSRLSAAGPLWAPARRPEGALSSPDGPQDLNLVPLGRRRALASGRGNLHDKLSKLNYQQLSTTTDQHKR